MVTEDSLTAGLDRRLDRYRARHQGCDPKYLPVTLGEWVTLGIGLSYRRAITTGASTLLVPSKWDNVPLMLVESIVEGEDGSIKVSR